MFYSMFSTMLFFMLLSMNNALRQLAFSGGGSFGAVEIGILKRILESENTQYYDLYTGISAGALNAGFLSYFSNLNTGVKSAEKMYAGIRNLIVYELEPFTGLSILNTDPLSKTLTKVIDGMHGEPVVHTLIGATNLYSGMPPALAAPRVNMREPKTAPTIGSSKLLMSFGKASGAYCPSPCIKAT